MAEQQKRQTTTTGRAEKITAVCTFFRKVNCGNGKNCKFSHDLDYEKDACKFFEKGTCKLGENCKFSHDPGLFKDYVKAPCTFFEKGNCEKGENCKFSHDLIVFETDKKEACMFFKKGNCGKGENCKFSHDLDLFKKNVKNVCKFFEKGTCEKGDKCQFYHDPFLAYTKDVIKATYPHSNYAFLRKEGYADMRDFMVRHDLDPKVRENWDKAEGMVREMRAKADPVVAGMQGWKK